MTMFWGSPVPFANSFFEGWVLWKAREMVFRNGLQLDSVSVRQVCSGPEPQGVDQTRLPTHDFCSAVHQTRC